MNELELVKYEAPEMEVLEVMVEKGFCNSPNCPHGNLENPGSGDNI